MHNLSNYSPEIKALAIQSNDLRSYMNQLEIQGDLWTDEDLSFFLYLEGLLIEVEEELHFLQVNEIF